MKRSLILIPMLIVCVGLFAENHEAHSCLEYAKVMFPNYDENPDDDIVEIVWEDPVLSEVTQFDDDLIPYWFEHLEFADGSEGYSKEFLQEHGGRVGKIIFMNSDSTHDLGCSGTLIGENYFLTAAHCAVPANVGVLFGYQIADINEDNHISPIDYPRVSLRGYLNDNGNYILYGDPGSEYSDVTEHPAYFQIDKNFQYRYNNDYSVENGWAKVGWISEEDNIAQYAETIPWPNDDPDGEEIGKIDYAIYKLESKIDFSQSNEPLPPSGWSDPWSWVSENNQDDERPDEPWRLLDNTNGARGWARVNTRVLQENSTLSIIGFPSVASESIGNIPYPGLKVVNSGSVYNGKGRGKAIADHEEDLLIFQDADIQINHSGSPLIDHSERIAGLVVWMDCAPGGWAEWYKIMQNIKNNYMTLQRPAKNYATPMWKICRASQIIKNAAKDMDCNGRIDWWDYIFSAEIELAQSINVVIDFNFIKIKNLEIPTTVEEIHIRRYDMDQKKVVTETREIPAYTYQLAIKDNGDLFYVALQDNAFYLFKNGTSLGLISNYPQLNGSSALVKGDDIYFAGGNFSIPTPMLPGSGNNAVQYITKISSDGQNGYNFSGVATIPTHLEDIRIFALGNDIYVSGNTTTNFVVYKLVADNQSESGYSLSVINASQPVRKDYNLTASEGKIIVSGGATDYISTVLNLDEEDYPSTFSVYGNIIMLEPAVSNNWVTVAENINDKIIMFSVTAIDNGSFVIVNPFITVGNSMQKFVLNLSDIPINNETIRVSFESHPLTFCLGESENTLQSGLGTSGECVLFTHPWYNSFSAGATVYSLDGKGERLYVGTNNAIKIYDISDPISPVLVSSFSTSSRVNDLEVYGDTLFAATNGGLYKLDASDPDELTQILFISATLNYQYKVEVYNGKLYVGDDNGIKIRDLETLSVLTSVNNGSVLDFAIENGEIGLYKDALFSPVEIRDAETLTLKANEFFGCFEIEVGSSDGSFYLSCDDETYRFEDDGDGDISFTELSGDIRELQDVYTYNGYSYMYDDENTIWISTSNDVPALCGNGIVEGDEVCDGAPINCEDLDSNYVSGTATCNSTCDGYNTNNCSDDGW